MLEARFKITRLSGAVEYINGISVEPAAADDSQNTVIIPDALIELNPGDIIELEQKSSVTGVLGKSTNGMAYNVYAQVSISVLG